MPVPCASWLCREAQERGRPVEGGDGGEQGLEQARAGLAKEVEELKDTLGNLRKQAAQLQGEASHAWGSH